MAEQPLISIIVPSYSLRRLADIFELLKSVEAQTYPNIETIVVVEHSPMLRGIIREYAAKNGNGRLKIIDSDKPGATPARNTGIGLARGEYLAFVDDDASLTPDWAAELVRTYRDENIAGVTGPILPLWEREPKSWFPAELDWVIGCSRWLESDRVVAIRSVLGTNASFRKDAMKLAGCYSSTLGACKSVRSEWRVIAEEAEVSLRVKRATGNKIVYNPKLTIFHRVAGYKLRWGFIAQRSYQVGRTRQLIKTLGEAAGVETDILGIEHRLLRRILTGLIPGTLASFPRRPADACRRLAVTVFALFFVALGYFSHMFSPARTNRKLLAQQEGVD
jgi:glycosyltransferase involved in cell wall biosynthesis